MQKFSGHNGQNTMPQKTVWVMSEKIPVPCFLFREGDFFQWTPAFTIIKIKCLR